MEDAVDRVLVGALAVAAGRAQERAEQRALERIRPMLAALDLRDPATRVILDRLVQRVRSGIRTLEGRP